MDDQMHRGGQCGRCAWLKLCMEDLDRFMRKSGCLYSPSRFIDEAEAGADEAGAEAPEDEEEP